MGFCSQCGKQLVQGENHACVEVAAAGESASSRPVMEELTNAIKKIDVNVVLNLLKNPQQAAALSPQRDVLYGIIGLAASIVGFLIWTWIVQKQLEGMLGYLFGGFGMLGGAKNSLGSAMAGKVFLISLISLAALIGSLWLVGNWKGSHKLSIREGLTYLGALQLASGAGFVIAGVLAIANLRLSFLLLGVNLFSTLVLTVMAANECFEIKKEQRAIFIVSSMGLYMVLVLFATSVLI